MVVPDIVTGLKVTPKSGEVFLSWDIPNDNGDPLIDYKTEYKLTSSGIWIEWDNGTAPKGNTSINELTNGESYDFRTSAINGTGAGAVSATVSTTPVAGSFTEIANVLLILKDHTTDVDLSSAWTVIEFEDGVPQSMKVTLSAAFGEYLTRGDKIQKYDRIYLQITDVRGNVLKDVFHIRKMKRSRKGGKGKKLILTCPHQSEHLWKRNISLLSRRISGAEAVRQIVTQLNDTINKGSSDPSINTNTTFDPITKKGIALDEGTSNNYTFEKNKLQQVFDVITDREAQPLEGGGSFEPFYIRFKSDYDHDADTDLDQVSIQAYPQGFVNNLTQNPTFNNIPNITLKHGIIIDDTTNTLENDSDEDPELATNIHLVGSQKSGDFLGDWSKYFGAKNTFENARTWNNITTFKKGTLVLHEGITYESITDSTNEEPPNASFWIVRTFEIPGDWNNVTNYIINILVTHQGIAYKHLVAGGAGNEPGLDTDDWRRISYVPTSDYSPLTKQNTQYWVNALAGAKHAATNNGQTQMVDPNVVVKDKLHPRTFVRLVGINPNLIPTSHKPNGLIPDAYRILCVNPTTGAEEGTGDFSGTDRNNLPFAGNVVEYDDPRKDNTGSWVVFQAKETLQDQEVLDWDEGEPWTKFPGKGSFTLGIIPTVYVNNQGQARTILTNDTVERSTIWEKGSYGIIDIPTVPFVWDGGQFAVFYTTGSPLGIKQFDCAHSVKWDSINSRVDLGNKKIVNADSDSNSAVFIKSSAKDAPSVEQNPFYVGFNFWPGIFPLTANNIPFGGTVVAGQEINTSTFDLDNMTRTADGTINWFGPKSEQYRPIQSFAMWFEFIDTFVGSDNIQSEGDYEFGIYLIDRRDNTRILPFTQGKNNDITPQEGKLPGEFYSGVSGSSAYFNARQPEPTDAFDKNNILVAGIFTRDSFDTQGRYKSGSVGALTLQIIGGKVNRFALATELEMAIDGFRPVKPLYVTNADEPNALPERNIDIVDQKKTELTNYQTAKNLVIGLARLFGFRQQRFEIDLEGRADIQHGDCIYYTDTEMISDTTDTLQNTLKMVIDKMIYKMTKTIDGPAGITVKASSVTRLWPEKNS